MYNRMMLLFSKLPDKCDKKICIDKWIRDDSVSISMDTASKKDAWNEHYNRLLKKEFKWNVDNLSFVGPPPSISVEAVNNTKIKSE